MKTGNREIGLHTDTHTAQSHKESIERVERALETITIHPDSTIILVTDLNNYLGVHRWSSLQALSLVEPKLSQRRVHGGSLPGREAITNYK